MEETKNLPKKRAQSQILDFFLKKKKKKEEGIECTERQGRISEESKQVANDKRVVIDVPITSDKMVGEHSAIETSLRNRETVLLKNNNPFGGPAVVMSGKSKQRSVLDTENVAGSINKSKRTYQLSSGTDSEPENSGGLSTEQKTKKKRKMASDNLELSGNYSESEMSQISEGVGIISEGVGKEPANTCVSDSESSNSETETAQASKIGRKTKKKPKRGFVKAWEDDKQLSHFLTRAPNNKDQPWCKFCHRILKGSKRNILTHTKSKSHIDRCKEAGAAATSRVMMSVRQKDIDVTNAEIRLSAWFASEDIPFIKANTLIPVLKACAPDSAVLKSVQMKRTKITGIVKNVLAPYERSRLSRDLSKSFYSLVVDETTDRGTIKSLVIIVKYKHPNTQAVKEEFLGILEVEDSSSLGQKTLIVNYLKKLGIPLNRMIGIGFDNASVNTGVRAGLGALLIAGSTGGMVDDALPELFVLGCTSHSLALVASHASKRLPEGLEPMLRDLINYVANSPKRIVELKEIQQFAELKVHRMLQISNTRWLSMEQAISRVLEQWNALVMFFTNHGLGDAAGDKSSRNKAAKILSYMKEPLTKAYFHFLAFTLNKINCLNLEFQSTDTRIHKLLSSSKATMKSIMKSFIKTDILENDDAFDVPMISGCFKDISEISFGPNTEIHLLKYKDVIPLNDLKQFRLNCLNFLVEVITQMRKRIDHSDPTLKALACLDPVTALSGKVDTLVGLTGRFSSLLGKHEGEVERSRNVIETQWILMSEHRDDIIRTMGTELSPSIFWKTLLNMKDAQGKPHFEELSLFMLNLCALPHSSAAAERQFSVLSNIKTKLRNSLLLDTIDSLMHAKQLVSRTSGTVHDWEIPSDIRRNFMAWYKEKEEETNEP